VVVPLLSLVTFSWSTTSDADEYFSDETAAGVVADDEVAALLLLVAFTRAGVDDGDAPSTYINTPSTTIAALASLYDDRHDAG
jgi:hypothetical protein